MKFKLIVTFFLIMLSSILLSGCKLFGESLSDHEISDRNMDSLIRCLEEKDREGLKKLCASAQMEQSSTYESDIDEQIEELCKYYKGTYISDSTSGGIGSGESYEYGKSIKHIEMLYDIHTTTANYHVGIQWYTKDDYDENNVGIWSLFIESYINDSEWTTIEEWEIGIHIRAPRE